jgi:adenosylmethionine-8-amino-7-oxononanoate aminotransferase
MKKSEKSYFSANLKRVNRAKAILGKAGNFRREQAELDVIDGELADFAAKHILRQFGSKLAYTVVYDIPEFGKVLTRHGAVEDLGAFHLGAVSWKGDVRAKGNLFHIPYELMDYHVTQIDNVMHTEAILFASKLLDVSGMDMVGFGLSGSSAVDLAMKIALQYHNKNRENKKSGFIAIRGGYHGSISTNLHLVKLDQNIQNMNLRLKLLPNPAENPKWYKKLNSHIKKHGSDIAGIIAEPVMFSSGVYDLIEPLRIVVEIARENDILIFFDEVVTSYAKTGRMFAFQHLTEKFGEKYRPDLVTLAKNITRGAESLSAVMLNAKVAKGVRKFDEYFYGFTMGGARRACQWALDELILMEEANAPRLALELGGYLLKQLEPLEQEGAVKQVRGRGLLVGIQFHSPEHTRAVSVELQKNGWAPYTDNDPNVGCDYINPLFMFNDTRERVDRFVSSLREALQNTAGKRE